MFEAVPPEIKRLATRISSGGRAQVNLVGGAVIDLIEGREVKDWDLWALVGAWWVVWAFAICGLSYSQETTTVELTATVAPRTTPPPPEDPAWQQAGGGPCGICSCVCVGDVLFMEIVP